MISVLREDAIVVGVLATISVSIVVSPVVEATTCAGGQNLRLISEYFCLGFLTTSLLNRTSDASFVLCVGVVLAVSRRMAVFSVFNMLLGVSLSNIEILMRSEM